MNLCGSTANYPNITTEKKNTSQRIGKFTTQHRMHNDNSQRQNYLIGGF
jgi:hypothetical protein